MCLLHCGLTSQNKCINEEKEWTEFQTPEFDFAITRLGTHLKKKELCFSHSHQVGLEKEGEPCIAAFTNKRTQHLVLYSRPNPHDSNKHFYQHMAHQKVPSIYRN